jgi:TRAP-type C4-dicarboxylate transport system substrate-binding protein
MNKTFFKVMTGLAVAATVQAASAVELKLADFQPATHPYAAQIYAPMGQEIKEKTKGAVSLRVFMGGELGGGPVEQYNRAVNGVADIAFALPGYTASSFPKTLLTELPGVIDPATGTAKVMANIKALNKEYRRAELLGLWNNAPNMLLMANKPVRNMQDLKGLKIRTPSRNGGLVIEAWGATPVSMPAPAIYNALQTGVIDGAMIDATTLQTFKLAEVTKFVTHGMKPTVSSFFLVMNRDSFKALSADQQATVLAAGQSAAVKANKLQLEVGDKALAAFAGTAGKQVIKLGAAEAAAFDAASAAVTKKVVAEADKAGLDASAYIAALQK